MKYLPYLIAGLALVTIGVLAGKGLKPVPVVSHDSTVVIRTRVDTVEIPVTLTRYLTLQGRVKHDTVEGAVRALDVTFDSTLNGTHVAGSADCLTGQVSLFAEIKDTVHAFTVLHDTLVNSQTVVSVPESESTLSLQAFAESDVLHGINLRDAALGVTGNLFLGPLTLYLQPSYNIDYGLTVSAGLSITLWER